VQDAVILFCSMRRGHTHQNLLTGLIWV
jgi:hypothetical protein